MKDLNSETSVQILSETFTDVYTVDSEIGRGKFAVVKRCKHNSSGEERAAKFIHKRRKGRDCRAVALREAEMLRVAKSHPRIVNLIEVYETRNELVIVTEYARGGELFNHIAVEGQLEESITVRLMRQTLEGVIFLHQHSIIHMDIKPQNILLTSPLPSGDVVLCDLGLARTFTSGEDILDIVGTPDYVAPEVLDYEPLSTACDIWSIGVLVYVMLTGCSPFAGDTNQETFLNISQVNLDFPSDLFQSVSVSAIDFMRTVLIRNPRITLGCLFNYATEHKTTVARKGSVELRFPTSKIEICDKELPSSKLDSLASNRLKADDCLEHEWLKTELSHSSDLSTYVLLNCGDVNGVTPEQEDTVILDNINTEFSQELTSKICEIENDDGNAIVLSSITDENSKTENLNSKELNSILVEGKQNLDAAATETIKSVDECKVLSDNNGFEENIENGNEEILGNVAADNMEYMHLQVSKSPNLDIFLENMNNNSNSSPGDVTMPDVTAESLDMNKNLETCEHSDTCKTLTSDKMTTEDDSQVREESLDVIENSADDVVRYSNDSNACVVSVKDKNSKLNNGVVTHSGQSFAIEFEENVNPASNSSIDTSEMLNSRKLCTNAEDSHDCDNKQQDNGYEILTANVQDMKISVSHFEKEKNTSENGNECNENFVPEADTGEEREIKLDSLTELVKGKNTGQILEAKNLEIYRVHDLNNDDIEQRKSENEKKAKSVEDICAKISEKTSRESEATQRKVQNTTNRLRTQRKRSDGVLNSKPVVYKSGFSPYSVNDSYYNKITGDNYNDYRATKNHNELGKFSSQDSNGSHFVGGSYSSRFDRLNGFNVGSPGFDADVFLENSDRDDSGKSQRFVYDNPPSSSRRNFENKKQNSEMNGEKSDCVTVYFRHSSPSVSQYSFACVISPPDNERTSNPNNASVSSSKRNVPLQNMTRRAENSFLPSAVGNKCSTESQDNLQSHHPISVSSPVKKLYSQSASNMERVCEDRNDILENSGNIDDNSLSYSGRVLSNREINLMPSLSQNTSTSVKSTHSCSVSIANPKTIFHETNHFSSNRHSNEKSSETIQVSSIGADGICFTFNLPNTEHYKRESLSNLSVDASNSFSESTNSNNISQWSGVMHLGRDSNEKINDNEKITKYSPTKITVLSACNINSTTRKVSHNGSTVIDEKYVIHTSPDSSVAADDLRSPRNTEVVEMPVRTETIVLSLESKPCNVETSKNKGIKKPSRHATRRVNITTPSANTTVEFQNVKEVNEFNVCDGYSNLVETGSNRLKPGADECTSYCSLNGELDKTGSEYQMPNGLSGNPDHFSCVNLKLDKTNLKNGTVLDSNRLKTSQVVRVDISRKSDEIGSSSSKTDQVLSARCNGIVDSASESSRIKV